ncbi:holo-ACP synthase, partial [Candidatus Pelagibacter sp.]|nr:holo-ACP synthase [Candidatus Pelagibacter sp.]
KEINNFKKKNNKISYLSKRFSAKEAFVKALGSGFRNKLCFNDISILNDRSGRPYFLFNQKIKNILRNKYKLIKFKAHLSLSDEKKHSISYVILQKIK